MNFIENFGVPSLILAAIGWLIKRNISEVLIRQTNKMLEREKYHFANALENIKSDLNYQSELSKIRFSNIYERKVNVLIDLYFRLQEYEHSILKISASIHKSNCVDFDILYENYLESEDNILLAFSKSSVFLSEEIISVFKIYKMNFINIHGNCYYNFHKKTIGKFTLESQAIDNEANSAALSKIIKDEIKNIIHNC